MPICPRCGAESPEGFAHCGFCGSALAAPAPERRKLATVLFCDVSGSTAIGERADPETVRELMFSYFHEMRGALERHGGTVEKFIGDAVVAVFGVPEAHEDDALRACRAGLEMQARLTDLNEELHHRFGTTIALRIGLNAGEVVAGDASARETFVTGDAVNVAARLEQAAAPGEVLLGEPIYRLVREAVTVEPVEPLTLKGKSERLAAYRLLEVSGFGPPPLRKGTPLVGREHELALLEREFEAARAEQGCRLVTIVGEPGVGKSRLAAELIERLGSEARVLRGRCLSYGEGITYWPVGEIVREAAAIRDEDTAAEARARIAQLLKELGEADAAASWVAQAIGLQEGTAFPEEIAWALRTLLETLARRRPLLVVIDDLQWAEEALLDLLGYLHESAGRSSMLVVCLARPEVLDLKPGWRAEIRLAPLAQAEAGELVANLVGGALEREGIAAIAGVAQGNPLFAEELIAMLVEEGTLTPGKGPGLATTDIAELGLPLTLEALLGARLDQLGDERSTFERGSIEGEIFHRGAVVELSAVEARSAVPHHLELLLMKNLIGTAPASFLGEAAFRFRHILLRDAAYRATAKKLRAELHERLADWLEKKAGDRAAEYEEILGYHLERAFRYREELGPVHEAGRRLASRAGGHLAAAGSRALSRGDVAAAVKLLRRAASLLPSEAPGYADLLIKLGQALRHTGDPRAESVVLTEAIDAARATGDRGLELRTLMAHAGARLFLDPEGATDDLVRQAEQAIPVFEELGDDRGLARAWRHLSAAHHAACRWDRVAELARRGIVHARRAGDDEEEWALVENLAFALFCGPTPVPEAIVGLEEIRASAGERRILIAAPTTFIGELEAMRGDFDEARRLLAMSKSIFEDLGHRFGLAWHASYVGATEMLADDPVTAEVEYRRSCEILEAMGERAVLSTMNALLAAAVYAQGRYEEAERLTRVSEEMGASDDVESQVAWRTVRAKALARRGALAEAELLAREAVTLASETDDLNMQGQALFDLAEVLVAGGLRGQARALLIEAARLFDRKGNVVSAARVRARQTEFAATD